MIRGVVLLAVSTMMPLVAATPVLAQVPCARQDLAFSCADGSSLAILDDPRMGRVRPRGGGNRSEMESDRGPGTWWRDEHYVHGPEGQTCLIHGNHVHCNSDLTEQ